MKWYYFISIITILLLTVSLFPQVDDNSHFGDQSKQLNSNDFSLRGISPVYGTQTTVIFSEILYSSSTPELRISSIIQTSDSELLNFDSFFNVSDFKEISLILLGSIIAGISKTGYSSKLQKEWAKNGDLIRQVISINPGISLRGISRSTGLAMGSTQYWVRLLEQYNEVDFVRLGKSKHYFDCHQKLSNDAKLLYSLIQNSRIKNILILLVKNPEISTQKELCQYLGYNKSLLSYYIKILRNHSILEFQMKELSISNDFKPYLLAIEA